MNLKNWKIFYNWNCPLLTEKTCPLSRGWSKAILNCPLLFFWHFLNKKISVLFSFYKIWTPSPLLTAPPPLIYKYPQILYFLIFAFLMTRQGHKHIPFSQGSFGNISNIQFFTLLMNQTLGIVHKYSIRRRLFCYNQILRFPLEYRPLESPLNFY